MSAPDDRANPQQKASPWQAKLKEVSWDERDPEDDHIIHQAQFVPEPEEGGKRQEVELVVRARGFKDREDELHEFLSKVKVGLEPAAVERATDDRTGTTEDEEEEGEGTADPEITVEMRPPETGPVDHFVVDPCGPQDRRFTFRAINRLIDRAIANVDSGSIAIRCGNGALVVVRQADPPVTLPCGAGSSVRVRCREPQSCFSLNLAWVQVGP